MQKLDINDHHCQPIAKLHDCHVFRECNHDLFIPRALEKRTLGSESFDRPKLLEGHLIFRRITWLSPNRGKSIGNVCSLVIVRMYVFYLDSVAFSRWISFLQLFFTS